MNFFEECFSVFQKGGPVMYLILLCSLLVVTIGIERFMYYRCLKNDMKGFIEKITPVLERSDWQSALQLCQKEEGIVATVAMQGIQCFQNHVYHMESVLEGEAAAAVAGLKENLTHLDTIVTIAPLLGLLGTVVGMIQSFSVMNVKAGQPMAITGGVGEALIATASGLCVAILAMAVYSYFNHRLDKTITQIEQVCTLLIKQIKRENRHEIA
ncbi:MotA/TolQ/ExbB proton channel family protein [Pelosinus sp. sgz500959]|uniref:MotA/TolQ/ExbB proton channel family protein n=1 Tax=Pelosinus sp. sgz500959 TaxID=3242472 RepID=UPI00366C5AFD